MDMIDGFVEKHGEIRRLMEVLGRCLPADSSGEEEFQPEMLHKFKETAELLSVKLQAHEALEQRFLAAAAKEMGPDGTPCLSVVDEDHAAINDIIHILESICCLAGNARAYSFRFSVSSLSYRLERHLNYEEKEVFPCVRRSLNPARMAEVEREAGVPQRIEPRREPWAKWKTPSGK